MTVNSGYHQAINHWSPTAGSRPRCRARWIPNIMPMQSMSDSRSPHCSSDGRGRRTEYAVKWKHDAHPPANIVPTIISLVHIAREPALQKRRAKVVAQKTAHRELRLLCVAGNRLVHVGGGETEPSHLPLAELLARRPINVDEVWIASIEREYH